MEPAGKDRSNIVGFDRPQSSLFENDENDTLCDEDNGWTTPQLGRYAEFMVCAELTKQGYYADHVDSPGFDIILSTDVMSVRVQVKSTCSVDQGYCKFCCVTPIHASYGGKQPSKKRKVSRADCDLLALYHHVFNTTVFIPISEITRCHMVLPVSQVREHQATKSLERSLRKDH